MRRAFYAGWAKKLLYRPSWADAVSSVFGTGSGVAAHYWADTMIVQHLWEAPIIGFAALGLMRLLAAPYELWKEQKDRADRAEAALDTDSDLAPAQPSARSTPMSLRPFGEQMMEGMRHAEEEAEARRQGRLAKLRRGEDDPS